ncbi:cysteine hydrolase family protein [Altericroceibacterium endophyticum]|uniref:Isochorismatase family protein n=1 Tax=Altericroceibacterium endophyticum TaxID=1808508 RepID=A0A6I4T5H9_9SPHN|nr:cysteine hydrolase family protein [Altericroceibacterium endophyticum]MXO65401.1 isochorismatase family protein [Altericroceibacterium endophyticum]
MSKSAVIVVDLQKEYLPTGKMALEGVHEAVSTARRIIDHARKTGVPVIHIRHEEAGENPPAYVPGTEGVEIIEEVAPVGDEPVICKNFPNSFRETELQAQLDKLGATQITMIGAMSHVCIAATGRAATDFGYDVTTIHDACATMAVEFDGVTVPASHVHAANMAALAFAYGRVISADEALAE